MGKVYAPKIPKKNIFSRFMDRERERNLGNRYLIALLAIAAFFISCKEEEEKVLVEKPEKVVEEVKEIIEFGFKLNDYIVKRDTVKAGESFGEILERNNIGYPKIFHIAEKT